MKVRRQKYGNWLLSYVVQLCCSCCLVAALSDNTPPVKHCSRNGWSGRSGMMRPLCTKSGTPIIIFHRPVCPTSILVWTAVWWVKCHV